MRPVRPLPESIPISVAVEVPTPDIEVSVLCADDRLVVRLAGELDLLARPALRTMVAAVRLEERPEVLVDLTRATFIDGTVLSALSQVAGVARSRGGRVLVVGGTSTVLRTLELGGVLGLVELVDGELPVR